jgi:hypothetical protein
MAHTTKPGAKPCTPASANTLELSAIQLKRGRFILEEIATLANETEYTCANTHGYFYGNKDLLEIEVHRLRRVINNIGHIADFGSSEIGGSVVFDNLTADWLLRGNYPESDEVTA